MAISTTTSSSTNKTSAKTMADLLKSVKTPLVSVRKGEVIKGKIKSLSSAEILIDINAKTDAVVLEKDKRILRNLLASLSVGEEVEAMVLNPESEFGNTVVSLRRFLGNLTWGKLEKVQKLQEPITVTITELTRGGYIAITNDGATGFLPNSHILFVGGDGKQLFTNPQELVGKKIEVYVTELNRQLHKIVFSQKAVVSVQDFVNAIKHVQVGQKIEAMVTNITPFGIFVSIPVVNETLPAVDGLLHISEISWEEPQNMQDQFTLGQKINAVVINIDHESRRVDISLKRLTADPFEEATKNLVTDQKVTGKVVKINANGVILALQGLSLSDGTSIEAIIRKDKIPPTVTFEEGQEVTATVSQIDSKRHKIVVVPVLKVKPIGYR